MSSFKVRPGIPLSDAEFQWPAGGGTYNVVDQLAAGGGVISTTNDSLIQCLSALPIDLFGTRLLVDEASNQDDFETRFADRTNRRRR